MFIHILICVSVIMFLIGSENAFSGDTEMPDVEEVSPGKVKSDLPKETEVRSPAVLSGLKITADSGRVQVQAGRAKIGSSVVDLKADAILNVSSPKPIPVKEWVKLWYDPPKRWKSRTKLNGSSLGNNAPAPYMIIPGSVRISDKNGRVYKCDRDYILDEDWNAVSLKKGGRMKENTQYVAHYVLGPKALDAVVLDTSGSVRLIKGKPAIRNPLPPECPRDGAVLAHLYWPGAGQTGLKQENIFPKGPPWKPPENAPKMSRRIPRTMARLKAGKPVTIVCWGDSVTAGGDANPREEKRYSALFEKALRKRYPNVRVENVAMGGSNSRQWTDPENPRTIERRGDKRPRWKWIADKKPDVVTIEFVNDCGLSDWKTFEKQYSLILKRIRNMKAEVILITPHFTMLSMMGFNHIRQNESRPYVRNLHRFAGKHNLALADVSRRWQHLWKEGLPYLSLLNNGINHPDNRGHEIFAEELMRCFDD